MTCNVCVLCPNPKPGFSEFSDSSNRIVTVAIGSCEECSRLSERCDALRGTYMEIVKGLDTDQERCDNEQYRELKTLADTAWFRLDDATQEFEAHHRAHFPEEPNVAVPST